MPDVRAFRQRNLTLHRFVFDDVSSNNHPECTPPSRAIMERMLKVFDSIDRASLVLFHCAAGISRSPAAAFLYLINKGLGYQQAYTEVARVRGYTQPNLLMIHLADDILGHNMEMAHFVAKASDRSNHVFGL